MTAAAISARRDASIPSYVNAKRAWVIILRFLQNIFVAYEERNEHMKVHFSDVDTIIFQLRIL